MRVCPKCGFIDPPYWKHVKYSYYVDFCSFESFGIVEPELAEKLKKGGDIVEDDLYAYRLTNTKLVVLRKAKIDFMNLSTKDFDDKVEKIDHGTGRWVSKKRNKLYIEDLRPYWRGAHPTQKKLLEEREKQ